MKRLIYLTYLGLLVLILMSCQKENIMPAGAAPAAQADDTKKVICNTYAYQTKTGPFNLGSVRTTHALVAFDKKVSPAQQLSILTRYTIFDALDTPFLSESGENVQVLVLKPNATCGQVETMLSHLERHGLVNFATPVFDGPVNTTLIWIGQTNEILITLKSAADYPKLQKLAQNNRLTIVDDWGNATYLLTTNKRSAGDALAMAGLLNGAAFVQGAEPNFLLQIPGFRKQRFKTEYQAQAAVSQL